MCAGKKSVFRYIWGPQGENKLCCVEQLEKASFSGIQNRSPLGQTNLWFILRQLNILYFCPVTSPSPVPKLHYDKTIKSISLPLSKEPGCTCMRVPSVGIKYEFWAVLKEEQVYKSPNETPWEAERKALHPCLPTTWTHEVENNSTLRNLSIYFWHLCAF